VHCSIIPNSREEIYISLHISQRGERYISNYIQFSRDQLSGKPKVGLSGFSWREWSQIGGNKGRLPSPLDIYKNCRSTFATLLTWICDSILPYNEIHMATEAQDKAAWRESG